jgi:hypothetical protein
MTYCGRKALSIENACLRVTVLQEGGHIAEIYDKAARVSPLWTPPWPGIEPSAFGPASAALYGAGVDAKLLAGIVGHNLCLNLFGPPSDEEAAAGLTAHGEGSIAPYELDAENHQLFARAKFPIAGLEFERTIALEDRVVRVHERVVNRSERDRAIGWTQHVSLGPPFLEAGRTQFGASATRSKVFETAFGADDYLEAAGEFTWPMAPGRSGQPVDLRVASNLPRTSAYTAHLMDRTIPTAYFVAFSPAFELAFGYVWSPADFPWMGIWEENHSRLHSPWNGQTLARGFEFGVSPMPETREMMVRRNTLFGVPTFLFLPQAGSREVHYSVVAQKATAIPQTLEAG